MNILINCSNLKVGGGLQVANSFIYELMTNESHKFVIVVSENFFKTFDDSIFPKNIIFIKYTIEPTIFKTIIGKDSILSKIEREHKIDRVFTIFGPSYWSSKSKHIIGFAKPQYIYTESPFFNKLSKVNKTKLGLKRFLHLLSFNMSSDIIITELWDVSNRLQKIFPKKNICTVTNTYNQIFDQKTSWNKDLQLSNFAGITLLTISANYPHKNLSIIADIISYLKNKWPDFNFRFVLTLHQDDIKITNPDILKHLVFLGKIQVNQCPYLYEQADFMILPTLLECFSATYAESLRMGVPIITTNLPFAKSICGEAAEYVSPLDPIAFGDRIYELSINQKRKEQLIDLGLLQLKKFDTAKSRTEKYLKIITS